MGSLAHGTGKDVTPCEIQPEIFFPEGYLGKPVEGDIVGPPDYNSSESMAARALCAGCWFLQECLEDAIERQPEYGIQAGLSPDEVIQEVVKRALQ